MKKFTAICLSLIFAIAMFVMSGCQGELDSGEGDSDSNVVENSQPTNSETSDEPNIEPDNSQRPTQSSAKPGNSQKPTQSSVNTGSSQKPTQSSAKPNSTPTQPNASFEIPEDMPQAGAPTEKSGDIWIAPNGSDSNTGTKSSPYYSLSVAVSKAKPGTTIFCMPGVYEYSQRVDLTQSGTSSQPIIIQAYNWGEVEFNFSKQTPGNNSSTAVGIYLPGNYWKIQGITVCYAGDNGIKVEGSYNYIGRCKTHHNLDTGIQLGFGHGFSNPKGELCSNNLIENCDSYLNCDHDSNFGADADGFACKMFPGLNNVFKGCRAWRNADDAWDLYEMEYSVLIVDCWAWESGKKEDFTGADSWVKARVTSGGMKYKGDGSFNGNGNGIKLGGNSSNGVQIVKNCVAFGCNISSSVKGFDQNHNAGGINLTNCVAWNNGYNFMLDDSTKYGHSIVNSLSFSGRNKNAGELKGIGSVTNCNFKLDGKSLVHDTSLGALTEADFITISEEAAKAPRQNDGSLPNNGFAQLKPTSPYYGKGMGLLPVGSFD